MGKKIKKLKFTLFFDDEIIDYQTVIEERLGGEISKLSCYYPNWECKNIIKGHHVNDSSRAYFVPDCDYEIVIKPIRKVKKNP